MESGTFWGGYAASAACRPGNQQRPARLIVDSALKPVREPFRCRTLVSAAARPAWSGSRVFRCGLARVRRGACRRCQGRSGSVPGGEPDGKAVPGADQRDVKLEHVDDPEAAFPRSRPAPHGNQPGQRVAWPRAGVVNVNHQPP